MSINRKFFSEICALVLIALIATLPLSAQFNPFDPLNLVPVFGGVQVGNNGVTFQPPHLNRVPQYLQALPLQFAQSFLNPVGSLLASQIRQSRQNVRNQGCGPAPPNVVNALSPFMPNTVFNGVCWATLTPGLGIENLVIEAGGMAAVTLDDTIVFKDQQAGFDPVLWAHELTHVLQYRRLSVEGFANIYTYDSKRIEGEAYQFQDFVSARINLPPNDPTWQQQYYDATNNWNLNTGMTGPAWSQQAKGALNPQTCVHVEKSTYAGGTAVQVFNDCPVTLLVTAFVDREMQTGRDFQRNCVGNCVVQSSLTAPGTFSAFPTPPGFVGQSVYVKWF
jgi:uncharacterized protein DUF4157